MHLADSPVMSSKPTSPPNIVFILADDLGWADLSCYGSTAIRTPNLDRLAAEGIRFTHGYSATPWCSSTRLALYTGRDSGRLEAGLEEPLRTQAEGLGIPAGHPTLPSLLAEQGYATGLFGKWHCGWLPWFSPLRIGFQKFFGNLDGAVDYFEHIGTLGQPDLYEGETPVEETGYYTDLIAEHTVRFIEESTGPFYAQVNFTAPHWPWEGRGDAEVGREIRARYESGRALFPLLHVDGGSLAKYGELVETMDDAIGTVLAALERTGNADNTIVIFTSDNGGERWSNNWPFVGMKGDVTEGGIRVPTIMRWPAVVPGGQESDRPVVTHDWTATLLHAGGTSGVASHPLDGTDLYPWLAQGASYPEHDLFFRIASQGALRRGPYKYVRNLRPWMIGTNWPLIPGPREQLFDVTVDGREAADIAMHHRELMAELRQAWDDFDRQLLPYPPDHPALPRQATPTAPAVSQAD
jgi:arylsulfatase A-like enzyme